MFEDNNILPPGSKIEQRSTYQFPKTESNLIGRSIAKLTAALKGTDSNLKDCDCAPIFFNKVLGPTADEVFLNILCTSMETIHRFTCCQKERVNGVQQGANQPAAKVVATVLESVGVPPQVAASIIEKSFSKLEAQKPEMASIIRQPTTPELSSEILESIGLSQETISKIIQASSMVLSDLNNSEVEGGSVLKTIGDQAYHERKKSSASSKILSSDRSLGSKQKSLTSKTGSSKSRSKEESIDKRSTGSKHSKQNSIKSEIENIKLSAKEIEAKQESSSINSHDSKTCTCCECTGEENNTVINHEANNCYQLIEENEKCSCCCQKKPRKKHKSRSRSKPRNELDSNITFCSRCYECSAPVCYQINRTNCGCKRSRRSSDLRENSSGTSISLAKGDTGSAKS